MAAINEMKKLASHNVPVEYQFMTDNPQMKWFGEHKLPVLLDYQISREVEDEGVLRIKWRYPYIQGDIDA